MARPKTTAGYQAVTIRFPKDILEECRAYAQEEDRSLNEQILNMVKRCLAEKKKSTQSN